MKTLVISKNKKIVADFNVDNLQDAINVIKNNNLQVALLDNELSGGKNGIELLKEILKFSKIGWIKLPKQIIIIESNLEIKKEMELWVKKIYLV